MEDLNSVKKQMENHEHTCRRDWFWQIKREHMSSSKPNFYHKTLCSQSLLGCDNNIVLGGGSGTHSACLYTIQQKIKVMIIRIVSTNYIAEDDVPVKSYVVCLSKIICNPPQHLCYLNKYCCPDTTKN